MFWFIGAVILAILVFLAIMLAPQLVEYREEIVIQAPVSDIFDHIRYQERLMSWSAWPSETGSACKCEGEDGTIGARTIFFTKKGERFGHQEVIALEPNRRIELVLESKGPPQRPVLVFELEKLNDESTRVVLCFKNRIAQPFNLLLRLFGIVRWTRMMHCKDLNGLKRYAEPPHLTYIGKPAAEFS